MEGSSNIVKEYFLIYAENLPLYYIFSIVVSFLSVFLTWWYHHKSVRQPSNEDAVAATVQEPQDHENERREKDVASSEPSNVLNQMKLPRQCALSQISAGLTEEQLKEEKEAEAQQLAAIYQLLQEQEEKFQVGSMEELEDQMKLYRL